MHLRALALLPLLLAAFPVRGQEIAASPVPLAHGPSPVVTIGRAEFLGLDRLTLDRDWFGGWSGMAWDGGQLVMVSDHGHWARLAVTTDGEGRPLRLEMADDGRLGGTTGGKAWSDAEEIAAIPGGWAVAFERRHRVSLYRDGLGAPPLDMPLPLAVARLDANSGLEAMTRLASGEMLLIAEGDEAQTNAPAWQGGADGWRERTYRKHGLFRPTGAAALPDGGALVVERRYTLAGGAAMRLVLLSAAQLSGEAPLTGEELARIEAPLAADNFEAVTAFRRADGRTVAWIVSDDNFNPLQSTLLLTLLLP